MKIINIIEEDFVNYKKPAMVILMPYCSGKCNIGHEKPVCHNYHLHESQLMEVSIETLGDRYLNNDITKAIVFQGLEPFDSEQDLLEFVRYLRIDKECKDDIVIYTGYTKEEMESGNYGRTKEEFGNPCGYNELKKISNVIVKFGRFIPDRPHFFDPILGIELASDNQFAEVIGL